MSGQSELIYLMMFSLIQAVAIASGMWWLTVAAHLINAEKFFIKYLHNRKPDVIRLFNFLAAWFRGATRGNGGFALVVDRAVQLAPDASVPDEFQSVAGVEGHRAAGKLGRRVCARA